MAEVKKLSDNEFQLIQLIKQDSLEVASNLGELEYQKTIIEDQISRLKARVLEIKKREDQFVEELRDKYGNVTINIETGEIE